MVVFFAGFLDFSLRLQRLSLYPMVTRAWNPNPPAATRPPRNHLAPRPGRNPSTSRFLLLPSTHWRKLRAKEHPHPRQRQLPPGQSFGKTRRKSSEDNPPFPAERAPDSSERAPTAAKPLPPLPHLSDFPACHVSFPFKQGRSWLCNPSPASLFPVSPFHLPPPTPAPYSPFPEAECGTLIH